MIVSFLLSLIAAFGPLAPADILGGPVGIHSKGISAPAGITRHTVRPSDVFGGPVS